MVLPLLILLADTTPRTVAIAIAPAETLQVTEAGTGDPVVLIPGLFGSSYGFRKVVPLLAASGYRTIVIEPLGVGRSARPERADYSFAGQADRVAAVLDSLALRGAIVVAHSVASAIALRLALRRPDLVSGIVSLEGGVAEAATTPGFRRAMKLAPLLRFFGGVGLIRGKIKKQLIEASADPSWVTDLVVQAYTAGATRDLGATLRAYRAMGRAAEPDSLAPHLGELACPVLLLLGGVPHPGGPPPGEIALFDRAPAFRTDTLPDTGHFPQEEAPARVAAAVDRMRATVRYLSWLFRE